MTEGGRRVALEEVMPHPGRKIARERRAEEPRPASGEQRGEGDRDREQRAADVQAARDRVAVLAEVIGIELAKAREGRRPRAHRCRRDRCDPGSKAATAAKSGGTGGGNGVVLLVDFDL